MIIVGYYEDSKTYRLTEPISKNDRIVKTRDVVFIEDLKEIDEEKYLTSDEATLPVSSSIIHKS